jgi:hypothetical protein
MEPLPIFQTYPILTTIVEFILIVGLIHWMMTSSK